MEQDEIFHGDPFFLWSAVSDALRLVRTAQDSEACARPPHRRIPLDVSRRTETIAVAFGAHPDGTISQLN